MEHDVNQDLNLVKWEQLRHLEVDQLVPQSAFLVTFELIVLIRLILPEVKEGALGDQLVGNDGDVADEIDVVIAQLLIKVLVLDLLFE